MTETGEGSEESFFDPNQVPEELKPAYKQMQAAFTKKTQEIANARKEAEALKERAEAYDKYQQYIPIVEEMLSGQSKESATQVTPEMAALEQQLRQAGYSDEAIDMMKIGAGFVLSQFNQTLSIKEQQAQMAQQRAELEAKVTEAESLDPRLKDDSLVYTLPDGTNAKFGEIVGRLVLADEAWQQDPSAATKRAIALVDTLIGTGKTQGKEELSASAKSKANRFPSLNSSPQQAVSNAQPGSIQEAFQQAKEELGV